MAIIPSCRYPICEKIGVVLEERTNAYGRRNRENTHIYLLSDVTFCAVCNQALNGNLQDGRRMYRHRHGKKGCPEKWVMADDLEGQVLTYLYEISQRDIIEAVQKKAEELAREAFSKNTDNQPLLDQLEQQQERLTRLEDLYLDGDIDKDRYLAHKSEIAQAIGRLEDKLYAANELSNFPKILSRMQATLAKLPTAPPETKKALINSMIERLEVGGGKIIHLTPRPWAAPFF